MPCPDTVVLSRSACSRDAFLETLRSLHGDVRVKRVILSGGLLNVKDSFGVSIARMLASLPNVEYLDVSNSDLTADDAVAFLSLLLTRTKSQESFPNLFGNPQEQEYDNTRENNLDFQDEINEFEAYGLEDVLEDDTDSDSESGGVIVSTIFREANKNRGGDILVSPIVGGSMIQKSVSLPTNPGSFKPTITTLKMRGCSLGDVAIFPSLFGRVLAENASLTHVDISENRLSDLQGVEIFNALEENNGVKTLFCSGNLFGPRTAEAMASAISVNRSLMVMNCAWNDIGQVHAQLLGSALAINSTLTKLDLTRCRIGEAGTMAIAEAMPTNNTIRNINLRMCGIGDDGGRAFAESLRGNRTLTCLDLSMNKIGASTAKALASSLGRTGESADFVSSLRILDLGGNKLGDEGAKSLVAIIGRTSKLVTLDLASNSIGDSAVVELADPLIHENRTLRRLKLSFNNITAAGAAVVSDVILKNASLVNVDLEMNRIGAEAETAFANAVRSSRCDILFVVPLTFEQKLAFAIGNNAYKWGRESLVKRLPRDVIKMILSYEVAQGKREINSPALEMYGATPAIFSVWKK